MKNTYGVFDGQTIQPPNGWKILQHGDRVPSIHREYIVIDFKDGKYGQWNDAKRCTSTMTAIYAQTHGNVVAYAVPA